jgi:N-acetylglucosamine-6-phosphate deacetylase
LHEISHAEPMEGSATRAVAASKIFDGSRLHDECAVVFQGARIIGIAPQTALTGSTVVRQLPYGGWIAPGFIDTQVNGGGDVLFNDEPSPAGIAAIVKAHRRFGTTALLPTFVSDTRENMRRAWSAVKAVLGAEPGVLGIHFEGPFLSPERAGVHDPRFFRSPEPADLELMRPLPGAVTLVTLAPERVAPGYIRQLATNGTRVSLGHSMATYAQTKAAISEGLTGFTHLFNAMRPLASREPGPIAAALEHPEVWFGMIVDGQHVAPAMLRLALRGAGRPILVSDAMPPVGGSRSAFSFYGSHVIARGPCCYTQDGTLAGTALDMASAVRNCVRLLGLPLTEALRLASLAPAAFLGLDDRLGCIAPGYRADMVALDPEAIEVVATWVAGEEMLDPGAVNAIR